MYVYIFEDGTVQQHSEAPTRGDLECIADGLLIVLKCEDVKNVCEDGELDDLTACEFGTIKNRKYHWQV